MLVYRLMYAQQLVEVGLPFLRHPELANIPKAINKRLSKISSDEASFQGAVPVYQETLTKSGYQHKLQFQQPLTAQSTNKKRKRK